MSDHPTGCVECELVGCPVEGMTMVCPDRRCWDVFCLGHKTRHMNRKHPKDDDDV